MKPHIFSILFSLLVTVSFAQEEEGPDRCHTNEYHEQLMQNEAYSEAHEQRMQNVIDWLKLHKSEAKNDCDEILYIPVAVHFQNPVGGSIGVTQACAEEMAISQINAINADFAGTNTDIDNWTDGQATWPGISNGESCIQFCLATLNHPAGSGIAEGDYAITIDEYDDTMDDIPDWAGYMNWAVRDMTNPLGFSPLGGTGNGDAAVCGLPYFGTSNCNGNLSAQYGLGRTMTHEVGHYLSLSHPFDSGNCTADGDGVDDTPFTDAATFGCPAVGEVLVNCTDPILFPTFMEYCDDGCLYMFTEEQVEDMEAYVNANLQNLLGNATTVCEDAACLGKDLIVTAQQESCVSGSDGSVSLQMIGGLDPVQYSFDGGGSFQGNSSLSNIPSDEYFVTVVDAAGCELVDSIVVPREDPGLRLATATNAFCGNPDGTILVDTDLNDDWEYNIGEGWQDSAFFDGLTPDLYLVQVRNDANCTDQIQVFVGDDSDLNLAIARLNPVNCPLFDNGLIDAAVLNGEPPMEFRLNDSDPKEVGFYDNLSVGEYVLSVEDQRGCKERYEFTIGVSYANVAPDCPCEVFIPNAMTPQPGDGLNDTFKPVPSCPITDYTLTIYDRLGALVFETRDLETSWNGGDGDFYGQSQIYFYKMTYRWGEENNESLELQEKTGFITVLR